MDGSPSRREAARHLTLVIRESHFHLPNLFGFDSTFTKAVTTSSEILRISFPNCRMIVNSSLVPFGKKCTRLSVASSWAFRLTYRSLTCTTSACQWALKNGADGTDDSEAEPGWVAPSSPA